MTAFNILFITALLLIYVVYAYGPLMICYRKIINVKSFSTCIEKLVRANNSNRAIKLCGVEQMAFFSSWIKDMLENSADPEKFEQIFQATNDDCTKYATLHRKRNYLYILLHLVAVVTFAEIFFDSRPEDVLVTQISTISAVLILCLIVGRWYCIRILVDHFSSAPEYLQRIHDCVMDAQKRQRRKR